jgi:hypothetical protein
MKIKEFFRDRVGNPLDLFDKQDLLGLFWLGYYVF